MAEESNTQSSSQGGSQSQQSGTSQQGTGSQGSQQTAHGQGSQQTQQSQQTQKADRPAYVPEGFYDAAKGEVKAAEFGEHINQLAAFKAAAESKRLSLPQKAEDYKVELPADFKPPEGIKYEFNANDPLLAQARTMAHEMGINQDQFSKLLGLYAGSQVASQARITEAKNAEIAKLGPTGPARIDALTTFYRSYLGDDMGKLVMARVFTAADVAAHEKMISKIANGGAGSFTTSGREPPGPQGGRVSDEVYSKMTPAQRLDYARKFPQEQFTNGRAA